MVYPHNGINTAPGLDVQKEHLLSQKDVCLILANVKKKEKKVTKQHVCYDTSFVTTNTNQCMGG